MTHFATPAQPYGVAPRQSFAAEELWSVKELRHFASVTTPGFNEHNVTISSFSDGFKYVPLLQATNQSSVQD